MTRPSSRNSLGRIWRWPFVLALLTVFGLLSALLGQKEIWWKLSWVALAIPLLIIALAWPKARARGQ